MPAKSLFINAIFIGAISMACTRSTKPVSGTYYSAQKTGIVGYLELFPDSTYRYSRRLHMFHQSDHGRWKAVSDREISLKSYSDWESKPSVEVVSVMQELLSGDRLVCFSIHNPSPDYRYKLVDISRDKVYLFDQTYSVCIPFPHFGLFSQILMRIEIAVDNEIAFCGGFQIQSHPFIVEVSAEQRYELQVNNQSLVYLDRDTLLPLPPVVFDDTAHVNRKTLRFPNRGWKFKPRKGD
jgi:hypothetical protein